MLVTIKKLDDPFFLEEKLDVRRDDFGDLDYECNDTPRKYVFIISYRDYEIRLIGRKFMGGIDIHQGEIITFKESGHPFKDKQEVGKHFIKNPHEVYTAAQNGYRRVKC